MYKNKKVVVATLDDGKKNLDGALDFVQTITGISPKVVVFQAASNSLDSNLSVIPALQNVKR
jgi:hypothetical protein